MNTATIMLGDIITGTFILVVSGAIYMIRYWRKRSGKKNPPTKLRTTVVLIVALTMGLLSTYLDWKMGHLTSRCFMTRVYFLGSLITVPLSSILWR